MIPESVRLKVRKAGHIGIMEHVKPSCLFSSLFSCWSKVNVQSECNWEQREWRTGGV